MLAQDIQERILLIERLDGVEPMSERALRGVGKQPKRAIQVNPLAKFLQKHNKTCLLY